jgi:hypothetical protein
MMKSKSLRMVLAIAAAGLMSVVGIYLYITRPHAAQEGGEVTPQQYAEMRAFWARERPAHYRLVARYSHQVDGCSQDVEIRDEKVINVFQGECSELGHLSVSEIFDLFQDFVGYGPTRPVASNLCMYYYVTGIFDDRTGFPRHLENHLASGPTRRVYFSLDNLFGVQSCLAIGPPQFIATIESVTALD